MKKTVATVSILRKGEAEWLFSVNMRLNEDDRDLPGNCYRDLGRALSTFVLHADLGNENIFEERRLDLGPYIYHDNEDVMGIVAFAAKPDADDTKLGGQLRVGVNAAASIIRQGGGRIVRRRIKPVEQLLLIEEDTEKGPAS